MIVESMNDQEFANEVVKDYFEEMQDYINRAMVKKGRIKVRHASNYTSERRNKWLIIYSPENGGQYSMHIKRIQPKDWFTWYSLIFAPNHITLFGFNKHVAERYLERYSERFNQELNPSEALMEMFINTPAIIQSEVGDSFYTRVNGGICLGSVYGKRFQLNNKGVKTIVDIRETKTFVSDDMLFNSQKLVTENSIAHAIEKLGINYLSDNDMNGLI